VQRIQHSGIHPSISLSVNPSIIITRRGKLGSWDGGVASWGCLGASGIFALTLLSTVMIFAQSDLPTNTPTH